MPPDRLQKAHESICDAIAVVEKLRDDVKHGRKVGAPALIAVWAGLQAAKLYLSAELDRHA